MSFWDKILGFFGIRRIQLDKPLTLLGHYYYKVLDKIANGYYSEVEDVDWGVNYIRNDEEDRNVTVCQWETIKIMHTIRHDETDSVVAAGRIYIDKDESFLDDIIRKVTLGKKRVHGKIDYRHHGMYDIDDEQYYHYDDDVYLLVYKETDAYDYGHSVTKEYVLRDSARKISRSKSASPRSLGDDRRRIMSDFDDNF
jgi:hypothetical protein